MKAVTWHGKRDVRVDEVPDPKIEEPTDAIVRITSTGICGSDLHLYEVLGPFMNEGDILGHEPMGIVEEVGTGDHQRQGRRPRRHAVPDLLRLAAACATSSSTRSARRPRCARRAWAPRCSATRTSTARCRGGQAEFLRVPQAQNTTIKVPDGPSDDRFVYLSDVLPTAWQAVEYAGVPDGGTLVVLGPRARSATCRAASRCTRASA